MNKWISVKDRLPPKSGIYITVTKDYALATLKCSWYSDLVNAFHHDMHVPPTHWAELELPDGQV